MRGSVNSQNTKKSERNEASGSEGCKWNGAEGFSGNILFQIFALVWRRMWPSMKGINIS